MDPSQSGAPSHLLGNLECSSQVHPKFIIQQHAMGPTLELLGRGPITLEDALEEEANIINLQSYGPATDRLYRELWDQRLTIAALTKHHLGLGKRAVCTVLPPESWLRGAFNVCVFVEVGAANGSSPSRKVIFRCPMPHKLA